MSRAERRAAAIPVALAMLVVTAATADAGADAETGPAGRSEFWIKREHAYRHDPRGPFTAIAAHYLGLGETIRLRVAGDTVLADSAGAGAGLVVAWGEDGFTLAPAGSPGAAGATVAGTAVTGRVRLGAEPAGAADVRLGRFLLSFDVQDPGTGRVLLYDPDLLDRRFRGFVVFPEDPRFRVRARCVAADGATRDLATSRGRTKPFVRAVLLEFELDGKALRLSGFRAPADTSAELFVPFRDATTAKETYGVGRYLTVVPEEDGASATVDFNRATNPWCAYSPWYNCVLPPDENVLPVAIRAGERTPAGGD